MRSCFYPADAVITGTRRRVKIEKIPQLLVAGCTAETDEPASDNDDGRKIGGKTTSTASDHHAHSSHPKKSKQSENTVPVGAAVMEEGGSASVAGESQPPRCEKQLAGTDKESLEISCGITSEAEVSCADLVCGAECQPYTQQVNSTSASKAVVNSAAQLDIQTSVGVKSGRQSCAIIRPKVVPVRRAANVPDQNCRPQ